MRAAFCPVFDLNFFPQTIGLVVSALSQSDSDEFDVVLVCDEKDVDPGWAALDKRLKDRIKLILVDWSAELRGVPDPICSRLTHATWRRLALHRVLPERYDRFMWIDPDTWIQRAGLGSVAQVDMGSYSFAATVGLGHLLYKNKGQASSIGLPPGTDYCSCSFVVVDRHKWDPLGEEALRRATKVDPRLSAADESVINDIVRGSFAPLSPRWNWTRGMEATGLGPLFKPVVWHWQGKDKPWDSSAKDACWLTAGQWFATSPWPHLAKDPSLVLSDSIVDDNARRNVINSLKVRRFVDDPDSSIISGVLNGCVPKVA